MIKYIENTRKEVIQNDHILSLISGLLGLGLSAITMCSILHSLVKTTLLIEVLAFLGLSSITILSAGMTLNGMRGLAEKHLNIKANKKLP
ncbi:hypothetical protein ACXHQ0_21695 [Vibrio antiquarius]|uniref:Uncharacterized protein n=1 Tax=Vibrio parahaemolyticus TaxID=670 RepID=A0AA46UQV7_VIBPH|nr:hypothetical protein [Vibrio parahaemolyticus]UYV30192.1 hypothetical protein M5598_24285 [Vibrio parahaemolyticus]UYW19800.1 hypothetical protein IF561_26335 [Vibrio parahaemolyticus]